MTDPEQDTVARRVARFVLNRLGIRAVVALRRKGALLEDGWFRSFDAGRPVDADGRPLPWLTYPAIDFLGGRIAATMSVFEFGCGWGTLWWAARVAKVTACEHDEAWAHEVEERAPRNVTLLHEPLDRDGSYCRAAARRAERFDIIVIDGRDRTHCALRSVAALAPGGIFVWDNTDRTRYEAGLRALASQGFRQVDFIGMVPGTTVKSQTSILYRSDNCLRL